MADDRLALWDVAGSPERVWALSSALYMPYGLAILFISERDVRRARAEDPEVTERASPAAARFSTYFGFPAVLALQGANVILWREFTPFLAALLWGLVGCAIGFAGLVRAQYR